jgi:2-polyprenyl-3-methyl-5-hydroxy-6-metoxy-1,4-benzoquinol methylase
VTWRDTTADPMAPESLELRGTTLRRAARTDGRDRVAVILDYCSGKKVLDVGCVDHEARQVGNPNWLHAKIAGVAASALGVDIVADGVDAVRQLGYEAIVDDITAPSQDLQNRSPFQVVVAGEVIEHVGAPEALMGGAAALLADGGILILTTPNPYALPRWRGGHLVQVWENVDHVTYLFPSGIAELGERTGLELLEFSAPLLTSRWKLAGHTIKRPILRLLNSTPLPPNYFGPIDFLATLTRRRWFMGETSVYVLRKTSTVRA